MLKHGRQESRNDLMKRLRATTVGTVVCLAFCLCTAAEGAPFPLEGWCHCSFATHTANADRAKADF
jgi:hypothetical protein